MNKIKILTLLSIINLNYFACVVHAEELRADALQGSHEGFIRALSYGIDLIPKDLEGIKAINNLTVHKILIPYHNLCRLVEIIAIIGIKGITPPLDMLKTMDELCEKYGRIVDTNFSENPELQTATYPRSYYLEDALTLSMKTKISSIDAEMEAAVGWINTYSIYSQQGSLQTDDLKNKLLTIYTNFHLARAFVEELQKHTNYDAIIQSNIYFSLLAVLTREKSLNPENPCIPKYEADIHSLLSHTLEQVIRSSSVTCLRSMGMIGAEIALTFVNHPDILNLSIGKKIDDGIGIFQSEEDILQLIIDENEKVLVYIGAKSVPTHFMHFYQYMIQEKYPDQVRDFMKKIREYISKLLTHKIEFHKSPREYGFISSTLTQLSIFAQNVGYPETSEVINHFLANQRTTRRKRGKR